MPVVHSELSFKMDCEIGTDALNEPLSSNVFQGVVRSKGFVHVVGRDAPYYWSHAGCQLQVARVDRETQIKATQEIVFIGVGMNQGLISRSLDACLVPGGNL